MRRYRRVPILSAALLTSLAAGADEPASDDLATAAETTAAAQALLESSRYSTRWQLREPALSLAFDSDANPLADVRFEDGSMISRVSRIRRLSLLTFAEFGDAQLYFGVNRDGLFGVHLGALAANGRERQLEVARMPWLADRGRDEKPEP